MGTNKKYIDQTILLLRRQLKKEILKEQPLGQAETEINGRIVPLGRVSVLETPEQPSGLFSMKLPSLMEDMDPIKAQIRYPSYNRPKVIKTSPDYGIYFTFGKLECKEEQENQDSVRNKLLEVRCIVQKANKRHVFYEDGLLAIKQGTVGWFDYRGYAVDGNYYNLLFLFHTGSEMIIGNFQCEFPVYNVWKPTVIKLLETIKFHDKEEETEDAGSADYD